MLEIDSDTLEAINFFPEYRSTQIAWQGLAPVACWLCRTVRPTVFVELGSYRGDSFFAFQQSANDLSEVRELIAIDSFEGDSHTGKYGQSVERQFRAEVKARNDKRIRVIKARFEQAAVEFEAETISMLHIDGAHDFESVRQDFETWLPLMCRDGVIIFHDVAVKKKVSV